MFICLISSPGRNFPPNRCKSLRLQICFKVLDTPWILLFTTVRHNILAHCETVYTTNICFLSLWRSWCSFSLPTRRFRLRILQGFLFSWTLVKFQKVDFPPKSEFFRVIFKSNKKSISLRNLEEWAYRQNFPQVCGGPLGYPHPPSLSCLMYIADTLFCVFFYISPVAFIAS